MKLDLTGLHISVTDGIREFVERKTEKLDKFFDEATICHVTFSANKGMQHVDIRIEYKNKTYMANETNEDLYYGIEKVIDKVESQVRKHKSIIERKRKSGISEKVIEELSLEEILSEEE